MKKKFVQGSKILLVAFVFLLIIFLCYLMSSDSEEVEWLGFVAIPFIIVAVLTIISFGIMFVCEVIELIKEKNRKAVLDFSLYVIGFTVILYGVDVFEHIDASFTKYLVPSFFMACFIRSLNYWKRV